MGQERPGLRAEVESMELVLELNREQPPAIAAKRSLELQPELVRLEEQPIVAQRNTDLESHTVRAELDSWKAVATIAQPGIAGTAPEVRAIGTEVPATGKPGKAQ